jgi:uncharacterized protein YjbI with pentapeptide repeats
VSEAGRGNDALKLEAWLRLVNGESLKDLSLTKKNKRIDLSGLELPKPEVLERWQTPVADFSRIELNARFYSVKLQNLDMTGSKLPSILFSNCEINNCLFDNCDLHDLRVVATSICNCSLRGANLRGTALGAVPRDGPFMDRRNYLMGVDFSESDLRETVYNAAAFQDCIFRNAKLSKVDFQSSTFVSCSFEGELREARFWSSAPLLSARLPRNQMVHVDFSRAKLRDVEFRGLTLEQVRLPDDADHIVINDFAGVLDKLVSAFAQQSDETARILAVYLSAYRKGTIPGARGVLNKLDIEEIGADAVERVVRLVREFSLQEQRLLPAVLRTWKKIFSRKQRQSL